MHTGHMAPTTTLTATEATMTTTPTDLLVALDTVEAEVREFARQFPTPNVLRGVALAESGRITWADLHRVCGGSLRDALAVVGA